MATAQPAIFAQMGKNQWYVHLSREEGADLNVIKQVLRDTRAHCNSEGINLVIGLGPTLLADLALERLHGADATPLYRCGLWTTLRPSLGASGRRGSRSHRSARRSSESCTAAPAT